MLRAFRKPTKLSRARRNAFLRVEELEDRRVLAGNVNAAVSNGNLSIVGDDDSNQVLVTRNADLSVTISSLDGTTTINGQAGPITLANARDDLFVNMNGGDDVIHFAGTADFLFRMYGNANIQLGSGNDELGISNFSVWKDLAVDLGTGNDRMIATRDYIGGNAAAGWGLRVGQSTVIAGNDGNDQIRLRNGEHLGVTAINTGSGDDLLSICFTPFRADLALNGGVGFDSLYSNSNTFNGRVSLANWEVADNTSCGPPLTSPGPTPTNQSPTAANDSANLANGASTVINVAANDFDPDGSLNLSSIVITQQPTNGSVTVNNNGTVTYTHNGSATTADTFRYTIKDNQGATSNVATVTLTVSQAANLAPTAANDSATLANGASVVVNVAANDLDPDGTLNLASIVITQQPTNGSLTVNNNGTVTYTHNGSATTSDTFSYTINDNQGATSNVATVALTITAAANQAPTAVNDSATLANGASAVINVAANDSDPDGTLNLASIVITQQPTNGSVTVNNNGTVTYTHNGSATTTDTFSYTIKDNQGATSNVATVTLTVTPPATNQSPVAVNDSATLANGASTVVNVAANDSDSDGTLDPTAIVITQQPTNGSVTVNNNGTVTYTHNGSATTTDTFSYTIKDNQGATSNVATVTLTITAPPVNQSPVANPDSATANEGGSQTITVAGNDSDPEGQLDLTSIVITQQPTFGTVTVNNNGTVTYVHDGSETTSDSFAYTIRDAQGNVSNPATVTITVTPVSDTPVANPDTATVDEGGSATVNVAANDTDAEGQLDLTSIVITQQPTNGSVTVNPNGTVVYQHNGSQTTSDSFRYTIKDADGNVSNSALVTITVNSIDQAPIAANDTATVNEGGTQIINVAANDSDQDGPIDLTSIVITQQPTHGTVTVNSDGTVTYVHNGSETTTDSFRYTIEDSSGTPSNEATVNITITPVSDTPEANNDTATVNEGGSVVINVAANDTDAEGGLDLSSVTITQDPANGTVTVNPNGTVVYTHDGSETTTDSFRYTIRDADGNVSAEATVAVTITPVNTPPIATSDTATVAEGGNTNVNVLANDSDSDGTLDPTTVTIASQPTNGTAVANSDGTITYTHDGSETTTDTFTYSVSDADGGVSNVASVTITVTPENDPPVATDDSDEVDENSGIAAIGNLLLNDSDGGDGGPLTVSAVGGSSGNLGINVPGNYGTFNIASDGSYTYTLDDDNPALADLDELEELIDSIAYSVSDGEDEDEGLLQITIRGVTD